MPGWVGRRPRGRCPDRVDRVAEAERADARVGERLAEAELGASCSDTGSRSRATSTACRSRTPAPAFIGTEAIAGPHSLSRVSEAQALVGSASRSWPPRRGSRRRFTSRSRSGRSTASDRRHAGRSCTTRSRARSMAVWPGDAPRWRALEAVIGRRYTQLLSDTPRRGGHRDHQRAYRRHACRAGRNELTQPMAIRIDASRGVEAFTPRRYAVFLHGLMETEFLVGRAPNYGGRLEDCGWTPVYVRYNTGAASRRTAVRCRTCWRAAADWPVDGDEFALIGHLDGRPCRAQRRSTRSRGRDCWVRQREPRGLLGNAAPGGAARGDRSRRERRARRSCRRPRGIEPFRAGAAAGSATYARGSLVDDDWQGHDPTRCGPSRARRSRCSRARTHCFVSCVTAATCWYKCCARAQRPGVRSGFRGGGGGHFALLNHPQVYDRLRGWLS